MILLLVKTLKKNIFVRTLSNIIIVHQTFSKKNTNYKLNDAIKFYKFKTFITLNQLFYFLKHIVLSGFKVSHFKRERERKREKHKIMVINPKI